MLIQTEIAQSTRLLMLIKNIYIHYVGSVLPPSACFEHFHYALCCQVKVLLKSFRTLTFLFIPLSSFIHFQI